jgi:tetratricopeptide (TPR) repeat protein/Tfp pilus assembly protein PilF
MRPPVSRTPGVGATVQDPTEVLPRDPLEPELGPRPRSPEADRLLALCQAPRDEPGPMVQLDRARVADRPANLAALEEWARDEERWSTVVEILVLRARGESGGRRVELLLEAASIAKEALLRFDLALQNAEAAKGPRPVPALLLVLADLYEIAGRPGDALASLEQLLQAAYFPRSDHPAVAARLGRLAASPRLDPVLRVAALRRASSLDRASTAIREALVRALDAGRSEWPGHTTTLPPSPPEIAKELAELALARPLADPDAIDLLRRSLSLQEDPDVREALQRAWIAGRRFAELERELLARVGRASGKAKVPLLCSFGELAARAPWSRTDLAREAYGNALAMDPECEPAFEWLLEEARAKGDLARVERLAERRLLSTFDPLRRAAVRHRVLSIWVAASEWGRVMRTLRGLLLEDPQDGEALALCEELLSGEEWARGLEALVASADSPYWGRGAEDARADLVAACLRVATARAAPSEVILPIATRLARLRPSAAGIAETIRALQAQAGCDDRALATVRARVDAAPSDVARAEALTDLGHLHRERWELSEAWTAFERTLAIDPTHPDALQALAELAREPTLEDRRESVLRRRLASLDAGRIPAHRAHAALQLRGEVLHEIAELTTDEDEAQALYGRSLEIDPKGAAAADEVTRMLAKKGDPFALAMHLDGRLAHADAAGRVTISKRLARLLGDELGEPAAAVARWAEVAKLAPPDDLEPPLALATAQLAAGQPARAIEVWTALVVSVPAGPLRTDLLRRMARATRDPAARAAAFRRVLGVAPDDLEALRELSLFYRARGEAAFSRELAQRLARAATDPAEKLAALLEAALHEAAPGAIATLRAALALDPANVPALERLAEVAREIDDGASLVESLERQLLLSTSPEDAADLAVAVAAVWSERLGQDEPAARSLERARRIDPRNDGIVRGLQTLYERAGDWPALARTLRGRLEGATAVGDRVDLLVQLARLHADHLGEPDVAVELFRSARELEPRRRDFEDLQVDALAAAGAWDKVVSRLEARAAGEVDPNERAAGWLLVCDLCDRAMGRPAAAFDAALKVARETGPTQDTLALLVTLARSSGRLADAIAVLDELSSRTPDPVAGARALSCAAEILERDLDAPSNALDRNLEILRRVGAGPRVAAEIERLALQEGRVEDWVSAELEREKLATERGERVAILDRAARALDSVQGEPDRAFELLLRALTIDPDDEDVADRLDELAGEIDVRPGTVTARARLAETHARLAAHGSWHLRRALSLYEAAGHRQAFDAAAALALAEPDDEDVRAALPRLAAEGARWGQLLSVYDELAGLVSNPETRLELRYEQAQLLQDRIGRPQPARALLTEVLIERPSLPGLHARALEVARASGQGREMARALEDRLSELGRPDRLAALRWLAELWAVVLDHPGEVARLAEELLAEDPSDARAVELLGAAYPKLARWDKLAELVWARATGPNGAPEDAAQAAELFMARLGDPVRALAAWKRATDLHPGHPGWLGAYAALLERAGDWVELSRVLGMLARSAASDPERVQVLLRRAKTVAEKLGDREEAISILEEARHLVPDSLPVLRDLERLYELAGRHADLASLRSDAADRLEDPEDAREVLLRLARGREARGDVDGAIDALWRAIAVTPEYVPTYGKLRALLAGRGTPDQLVDLLLREAAAWTDPAESSERLCEAAAIVAGKLRDEDRARALYHEAIEAHERCGPAARALADDAERRGDIQEAISWLEALRRWTVQTEEVARIDRRMERLLARASTRIVRGGSG